MSTLLLLLLLLRLTEVAWVELLPMLLLLQLLLVLMRRWWRRRQCGSQLSLGLMRLQWLLLLLQPRLGSWSCCCRRRSRPHE